MGSYPKALAFLGLAFAPAVALSVDPANVTAFSPSGTAKEVRQVTARFSAPMVAFGDPRAAAPFDVACPAKGRARWADTRNWVYDFDEDVPGGVRCRFALKGGLRSAAGVVVTGQRNFAFDTGGPSVRMVLPSEHEQQVEEKQVFLVALNAPADLGSVRGAAACEVDGISERIPLDVLDERIRDRLLNGTGRGDWRMRYFKEQVGLEPAPMSPQALARAKAAILAVKCRRPLPPAREMSLVWPAEIRTIDGLAVGRTQRFRYEVRPPFTARFECRRVNAAAGCSPIEPLRLKFSAPVPAAHARAVRLRLAGAPGQGAGKVTLIAPKIPDEIAATVESIEFAPPLPSSHRLTITLPANLRDESGRPLSNAERFPLAVRTDEAPPLVKFAGTFGILEAREGGVLPVTVRNIEPALAGRATGIGGRSIQVADSDTEIARWLRRLEGAERSTFEQFGKGNAKVRINTTRSMPLIAQRAGRPLGLRLPGKGKAFEVVGIPLVKPGFHVVELASPRLGRALLGREAPRYVATGALVTNMAVHFQWGRAGSLVWVTTLDGGKPVASAAIRVSDSCTGAELWRGTTDRAGRVFLATGLPEPQSWSSCDKGSSSHALMVSARVRGDMSFTLTDWGSGIGPGDFDLPFGWSAPRDLLHTVFDRTLLRAGETVSMKHVMRKPVVGGIALPKGLPLKATLRIRHTGSDDVYEQPLTIGSDGIGESRWTVPKVAKLGDYMLEVDAGRRELQADGRFRVEEFRLPTMHASIQGPKGVLVNPRAATVDLYIGYLSGGGAPNLPVKLRTLMQPRSLIVRGYEGYSFEGEAIEEGVRPLDENGEQTFDQQTRARLIPLTLDARGGARATVGDLAPVTQASDLVVEMDYEDANGEVLTQSARLPVDPAAVRIGVKPDGWIMRDDDLRLKIVALDVANRPVKGQRVEVALFSREYLSTRKRLIGGFYAYDNTLRTTRIDETCSGTTDDKGLLTCKLGPGVSGEVYVQATARDRSGNVARATRSVWLVGEDDWWFGGDNGDRMDVIPERTEYAPTETARFQVRMPFRHATVLVTVQREGVLSSFVTQLEGHEPVISVPLKGSYAPNVYVSVLAVRGRVSGWRLWLAELAQKWDLPWLSRDGAKPTTMVDLAKPAYRLGIAKIDVGLGGHRLDVMVRPQVERYRVRQTALVDVAVRAPQGRSLPHDAEIAVAGVDEALLQLVPNESWNLLGAMMGRRDLSVLTSTAQMQVVGKRHYGRKAVAAGGGGGFGLGDTRTDFQPLLLWRGRVKLDRQGRARIAVPLSDALSSFRIVAVATAGSDLFGTGEARLRTVQDLSIFAGVPPLVRDGDRYAATFTLRNSADQPMRVTAIASTLPVIGPLKPLTVTVPAGGAVPVSWVAAAPAGQERIAWTLDARSADGRASDRVRVVQSVIPTVPVSVLQATLAQVTGPLSMPVAVPTGALPRRGGVDVALSPSLAASLEGVRAYMAAYPYSCLEQQVSQAVALGSQTRWDGIVAALPRYLDGDGLVRYFPTDMLPGDDVLTAYLLAITHEAGLSLPERQRQAMLGGLRGFVEGRIERPDSFAGSLMVRKLAAIEALARHGAATPAMLDSIDIDPQDWPTSALLDWLSILDRLPNVPERDVYRSEAETILRARMDFQGTTLGFSTASGDRLWWMMVSNDQNAVRSVLQLADKPAWREDVGRLMRGALARQRRGHWDTTTANAWGTLAVRRFAATFETTPVQGATRVALASREQTKPWPASDAAPPLRFDWPPQPSQISIQHEGAGRPWAFVTARAAVPLTRPLASGYRVRRSVVPVEQKVAGRFTRGDVVRVRIVVDAQAERNWVVVNDPIPGGATIVGGLGGQSALLGREERGEGTAWLAFTERRQDSLRAYYAWVPKGRFITEYTLRLNGVGTFRLPPTRVEALYTPEAFAMLPNRPVAVTAR